VTGAADIEVARLKTDALELKLSALPIKGNGTESDSLKTEIPGAVKVQVKKGQRPIWDFSRRGNFSCYKLESETAKCY
jgi:hypothetical protein